MTNRGYVNEQLLEARRRTALHCRVKGQVDRDYLVPDAPPFDPGEGRGVVGILLAILAGVLAVFLTVWGPRLLWWLR